MHLNLTAQIRCTSGSLSIAKVARVCGFTDIPHLQVVFKKRFGLPMGKWRQAIVAERHPDAGANRSQQT